MEHNTPNQFQSFWRNCKWPLWIISASALLAILIIAILVIFKSDVSQSNGNDEMPQAQESIAVQAGKNLSHQACTGEDVTNKLSVSPMKPEDFNIVVPYGLVVGAHVTPIDHQYFTPKDYNSPVDAYEVYAMGDAHIVDISARTRPFGEEYRLVFSVSCTYFYYYDLVTSLVPDIKAAYDDYKQNSTPIDLPVSAGQLIGYIGGQTLDFAVWDTTKPLSGFVIPEHYSSEPWKIYTADPLNYYTDELKTFILSRYVRTAQPISGKIDYDIDGRLIGNWFLEGTNGYEGDTSDNKTHYWSTHLSFAPDLYDPNWFIVSIGSMQGHEGLCAQFVSTTNTPNPQDVSTETGLIKYNLKTWSYIKPDGNMWDQNSLAANIKVEVNDQEPVQGCALVQMIEDRKIKFQVFKNQACNNLGSFTDEAQIYNR
ncbi:MAG: hypothetical protein PVI21_03795 [Candidatus Woesebacteria bacterium]|jgi:hypothetical protein